jgi:hypothetical protein
MNQPTFFSVLYAGNCLHNFAWPQVRKFVSTEPLAGEYFAAGRRFLIKKESLKWAVYNKMDFILIAFE